MALMLIENLQRDDLTPSRRPGFASLTKDPAGANRLAKDRCQPGPSPTGLAARVAGFMRRRFRKRLTASVEGAGYRRVPAARRLSTKR